MANQYNFAGHWLPSLIAFQINELPTELDFSFTRVFTFLAWYLYYEQSWPLTPGSLFSMISEAGPSKPRLDCSSKICIQNSRRPTSKNSPANYPPKIERWKIDANSRSVYSIDVHTTGKISTTKDDQKKKTDWLGITEKRFDRLKMVEDEGQRGNTFAGPS